MAARGFPSRAQDKFLAEFARHHGFERIEAEFEDGWFVRVRGHIGEVSLEVDDGIMGDALTELVRRWPRTETWPPAWLRPREKAWTPYPWPFGRARDYYDREDT